MLDTQAGSSMNAGAEKAQLLFPMVIAITALILSVVSGVVNYRQNNLSNLESSLRDTRVQLQLAKNDITDIKVKTITRLVEAELAAKDQQHLKLVNSKLVETINDAKVRINELESQIKRMDHQLVAAKSSLKHARSKASAKKTKSATLAGLIKATSLDIFTQQVSPALQADISKSLVHIGFKPNFPAYEASKVLANSSTVFYYHSSYKSVGEKLVKELSRITKSKVLLKQGTSSHEHNKIIVHLIRS